MKFIFIFIVCISVTCYQCKSDHEHSHDHRKEHNHNHDDGNSHEEGHKTKPGTSFGIMGKTIEYTYGENIYHLTVDTDSTLHWEAMTGSEKGATGDEKYIMDRLENGEIFITWGEENGTGVSQVLDFNNGKVFNHLSWDRKVSAGVGKIKILE